MAACVFQFDGAEISDIKTEGDHLTIGFSKGLLLKSERIAGIDPSTLWTVEAQMILKEVSVSTGVPSTAVTVRQGRLQVNEYTYVGTFPLPMEMPGIIQLQLEFADSDAPMVVEAGYVRYFPLALEKYVKHVD